MSAHGRVVRGLPALGLLAAICAPTLEAQVGTVQGRVRDDVGSAVFAATVRLLSGTTQIGVVDTDRLGSFRIVSVPGGTYQLQVQALGYAERVEVLTLVSGQTLEYDVRLQRQAIEPRRRPQVRRQTRVLR